jgi:hypothetical protein
MGVQHREHGGYPELFGDLVAVVERVVRVDHDIDVAGDLGTGPDVLEQTWVELIQRRLQFADRVFPCRLVDGVFLFALTHDDLLDDGIFDVKPDHPIVSGGELNAVFLDRRFRARAGRDHDFVSRLGKGVGQCQVRLYVPSRAESVDESLHLLISLPAR